VTTASNTETRVIHTVNQATKIRYRLGCSGRRDNSIYDLWRETARDLAGHYGQFDLVGITFGQAREWLATVKPLVGRDGDDTIANYQFAKVCSTESEYLANYNDDDYRADAIESYNCWDVVTGRDLTDQ